MLRSLVGSEMCIRDSLSIERPVVDLPQPDSPTNDSVSASSILKLIFSTAWTLPDIPLKKPFEISNLVVRFSTFNNGSTALIDDMI